MKDLNFQNSSGTVNVTYRTDLLGTAGNFTVHTITGLDGSPITVRDKLLLVAFKKIAYNTVDFINFARTNELQLICTPTNGGTPVTLWAMINSASDSGS
jgi:hypothetical protein